MEMDPLWLETVLRHYEAGKSVARVAKVEEEEVMGKGDNYGSDITRVRMEVFLGSGRKARRSVIVKTLPNTEMRVKHLQEFGVFTKEITMYTTILPSMERLMEEVEDKDDLLWPECIEVRRYDRIVLADLKEMGYYMGDRRGGLDFQHAALTLRALAKFHALSVALKERGEFDPDDFGNPFFRSKPEMINSFYNTALEKLRAAIETTWPPEEKFLSEKLAKLENSIADIAREQMRRDDTRFNVLIHMDCWVNNILFKYNQDGTPVSLRFLDYQLSHYTSYGVDLQYFMTTSLPSELLEKRSKDLLRAYHDSLHENLKKFNCRAENAPDLAGIVAEMKRLEYLRLALSLTSLAFMKMEPEDAPDLEEVSKKFLTNDSLFDIKTFLGKAYTEAVRPILKRSVELGLI